MSLKLYGIDKDNEFTIINLEDFIQQLDVEFDAQLGHQSFTISHGDHIFETEAVYETIKSKSGAKDNYFQTFLGGDLSEIKQVVASKEYIIPIKSLSENEQHELATYYLSGGGKRKVNDKQISNFVEKTSIRLRYVYYHTYKYVSPDHNIPDDQRIIGGMLISRYEIEVFDKDRVYELFNNDNGEQGWGILPFVHEARKVFLLRFYGTSYVVLIDYRDLGHQDNFQGSGPLTFIRLPSRSDFYFFIKTSDEQNHISVGCEIDKMNTPGSVNDLWLYRDGILTLSGESLYYCPLKLSSNFWFPPPELRKFSYDVIDLEGWGEQEDFLTNYHLNTLTDITLFHQGIVGPDIAIRDDVRLYIGTSNQNLQGPFLLPVKITEILELSTFNNRETEEEAWLRDQARSTVEVQFYLLIDLEFHLWVMRWKSGMIDIRLVSNWSDRVTTDRGISLWFGERRTSEKVSRAISQAKRRNTKKPNILEMLTNTKI